MKPDTIIRSLDSDAAAKLAMAAGDIAIILDKNGKIVDASGSVSAFPGLGNWIGRKWIGTVTVESKPKIEEMLEACRNGEPQRWRQVNHMSDGSDIPVRYFVIPLSDKGRMLALGRDMRDSAALQQRLLQAQQSLERDYMRLRQAESRYRLLFEMTPDPILIVETASGRVREANTAAHDLVSAKPGSLIGKTLSGLFEKGARDTLTRYLGSAITTVSPSPVSLRLAGSGTETDLSATGFRQDGTLFMLVRLSAADTSIDSRVGGAPVFDILNRMPDAFVVADKDMNIVAANAAFLEMAGAASLDQLRSQALDDYLGRPGVDLDLIRTQLAKHGVARNVGTVMRPGGGTDEEEVEVSAVQTTDDGEHYGFSIRMVGRRLRDISQVPQNLPRSVEQLTELVGRTSLKEIVRESTDLIERLCIEAALIHTSDNRASAAEILGLSRQSLYSKLHRYGLGNLVSQNE
ncbi:transcriptional regulator PpsR [Parasphingopyxis algicola]|uniref:transcriptional regulator PpsR n=1 Tax=Parasphingopyxis algicola TaxID=2026624 RepID=UPI0015A3DAD3|nr:transcriptional regulator PpsR [Parasphingopyxis algicola]QLC24779.1 transcriptional regulator PpsR [Parasphingopyxis algicola]